MECKILRKLSLLAASLFLSTMAEAGTVAYVGSDLNLGSGWRTSSVAKTDIDGDGVLGSDGWIVVGSAGSTSLPAYLTGVSTNTAIFGGNEGYYSIDDPLTTPGVTPGTLVSGTWNPGASSGTPLTLVSFTLGGTIPTTIQIGLMIDNLDRNDLIPPSLGVVQTDGTASAVANTSGAQYRNRTPDWVYFQITGVAGNQFAIQSYGSSLGVVTLGAVSFDSSTVPEPSTFAMFGFGMAAVGVVRIRRSARRSSGARSPQSALASCP